MKEFEKLDVHTRDVLRKKLISRLDAPRVPSAAIQGGKDCYKIKLRDRGLRLVYRVNDGIVTVIVLAVGKRERGEVYAAAIKRLSES